MPVEQIKHYFKETPILESKRLLLRGVKSSDAVSIVDLAAYDGQFAKNEADVLAILEKIRINRENGESVQWLICLKEGDQIAGLCSYHRGYPNNVGEIGYVLKESFRGQGIMTEAAKLITDFGINVMNLSNVVAFVDPQNKASINVLKRVGFQEVERKDEELTFLRFAEPKIK